MTKVFYRCPTRHQWMLPWLLVGQAILMTNCSSQKAMTAGKGASSTILSLGIPSNKDKTSQRILFDHYSLSIKTNDAKCKNSEVTHAAVAGDNVESIGTVDLSNSCDYSLILEYGWRRDLMEKPGSAKGNGAVFSRPLYSNTAGGRGPQTIYSKDLMAANGRMHIQVVSYKTEYGEADTPSQIISAEYAEIRIESQYGDPKPPYQPPHNFVPPFVIPQPIQQPIQPPQTFLSAKQVVEATSTAQLTQLIQSHPTRKIFILFGADFCPPCHQMHDAMKRVAPRLADNNPTILVHIESYRNGSFIPTIQTTFGLRGGFPQAQMRNAQGLIEKHGPMGENSIYTLVTK